MPSLVQKPAPDFKAKAVMPDNSIVEIALSDYRDRYVVLFFYPLDFTFVCPTEIIAFDESFDQFRKKNAQLIGVSIDSEYTHLAWKNLSPSEGGIGAIRYPLVSDLNKEIARSYGVLTEEGVALRGLFIIDKEGIVRHELINDLGLGRSVTEAFRILDALKHYEDFGEVCPANWEYGEKAVVPTSAGIAEYLSSRE